MQLLDIPIAVIGPGAMGEAIIGGLVQKRIVAADQIIASHPREERRRILSSRYGIRTTADNREAASAGRVIIFAVKPQQLPRLMPPLREALRPDALVISVIAGVTMAAFQQGLNHPAQVRSMPNTPAQIGSGMTVWTASSAVTAEQRHWAATVLGALGHEVYVDTETYLDMATAINGTGPAYVFLMMEAMIDAGVHLGLSRRIAEELVQQTMLGSILYAQQSGQHPAQLRNAVTSPGGTSAAALSELERGGLRTVLSDAIWAAYRRSVELGKQS